MSSNHSVLEALNLKVHKFGRGITKMVGPKKQDFFGQKSTYQKKALYFVS